MNVLTKYSSTLANDASYGSLTWFIIFNTPNSDSWGDSRAQSSDLDGSISNYLKCTNFNFSIPTGSVIIGITAELYINGNWQTETLNSLKLVKNDIIVGTEKGDNSLLTITNPKTFGGSSDLWGTTWTAADISNSNFGLVLACQGYSSGSIVSIMGARITINYISSQHNYIATGGLILSKAGIIDEDFSVNFGSLIKSNSDAGYIVRGTGNGGQTGDGSGGLSYDGYVARNDSSPYATPAILYGPSSSNFTAEIKFVCPSETTGSLSNLYISLFYRIKDSQNYRELKMGWYLLTPGGTRFALQDVVCDNGVVTSSSWFGFSQMLANKQSYVIFKFKIVNDKIEVIFNNLNTLDVVTLKRNLFYPTTLLHEGGVGFGFDSNEKLVALNSIPGSTSFKPDYFKAFNIPYENLGGYFDTNGGLTLSGNSLNKVTINYVSSGSLQLSDSSTSATKSANFILDGSLFLSGESICVAENLNYLIDFINNPLILSGDSDVLYKTNYVYVSDGTLLLDGDSNEFYRIDYVSVFDGGLILSGSSIVQHQTKYTFDGGLILSGSSIISNKVSYHVLSSGGLILGGNANAIYKNNYHVLSSGNLILGGNANTIYTFAYKYQPINVNLILTSSNLIKYSINLRYLLNNSLLKLFGKAKNKNRLLINNSVYIPSIVDTNEVKLISTKKEDVYLQWQIENNVVISKFSNK